MSARVAVFPTSLAFGKSKVGQHPLSTKALNPIELLCRWESAKAATKTVAHKQAIISYLTENVSAKSTEIAELLGLKPTRAKEILAEMVDEDIFVPEGSNKNRVYKLKS